MKNKDNLIHNASSPSGAAGPDPVLKPVDYHALFDHMLNGYAYCRMIYENGIPVDFEHLAVNPAYEKVSGIKNPVGSRITEVIPGFTESSPDVIHQYHTVSSTGITERAESYFATLDRWFSRVVFSTEPGYFSVVFEDITDRKKLEAKLKMQERLYRELTVTLHDIIWETDASGLITHLAGNCDAVFGYHADELVGQKYFYELLSLSNRKIILAKMASIVERKESFRNLVAENTHRNGSKTFLEASGIPVIGAGGALEGYRGIIVDVTQRETTRELLRASEHKFSSIFRTAPLLFTLTELSTGVISEVNDHFLQVSGFSRGEVIGRSTIEIGWIKAADRDLIKQILQDAGVVEDLELIVWKKNGEELFMAYAGVMVQIGGRDYLLSMGRDITLRKQAEEALKQSEVLLGQSRLSSHFIFNALNSIQSYILKNDTDNAMYYLSLFSKLIRATLEFSMRNQISLSEELAYLTNFIDLQKMRFECTFKVDVVVGAGIDPDRIMIPPMLMQPLVEDLIRHGLNCPGNNGVLILEMMLYGEADFKFIIRIHEVGLHTDKAENDPYRVKQELKMIGIVEERIRLWNKIGNTDRYRLDTAELTGPTGLYRGRLLAVRFPLIMNSTE